MKKGSVFSVLEVYLEYKAQKDFSWYKKGIDSVLPFTIHMQCRGTLEGLFTPSVSGDSRFDTSIDALNEYIGFNCIIHTKRQHRPQY